MACSKYTLTNTGSTVVNFSYRRCEDSMWDYQVELVPNQLKNIWVINGTYTVAPSFKNSISFVDNGPFPPISATNTPTPSNSPTPTPSLTPSNTPTQTPTPSVTAQVTLTPTPTNTETPTQTPTGTAEVTPTPSVTATNTQTPTPTNVLRTALGGICHSEFNGTTVCECPQTATIFVNGTSLADSTLAWSDEYGVNTGNPEGWYVEDGIIYEVSTGCGPGCITGATITVDGTCGATPTPTNTQTPTETPTNTPTSTLTATPTPTPTSPLQSFNVFSGTTSNEACETGVSVTIYAFDPLFDQNTQFYDDPSGVVISDMTGFYSDGTSVTELDSDGTQVGIFTACGGLVTPTPTATETSTPTPTPTVTQTPTQTFAWYTYSLGTGATSNDACTAFSSSPQTIYGTVAGGVGPNIGEFLYETAGRPLTDAAPDGYYSNGTAWYQVTGGSGQVTSSDPNGCI